MYNNYYSARIIICTACSRHTHTGHIHWAHSHWAHATLRIDLLQDPRVKAAGLIALILFMTKMIS